MSEVYVHKDEQETTKKALLTTWLLLIQYLKPSMRSFNAFWLEIIVPGELVKCFAFGVPCLDYLGASLGTRAYKATSQGSLRQTTTEVDSVVSNNGLSSCERQSCWRLTSTCYHSIELVKPVREAMRVKFITSEWTSYLCWDCSVATYATCPSPFLSTMRIISSTSSSVGRSPILSNTCRISAAPT